MKRIAIQLNLFKKIYAKLICQKAQLIQDFNQSNVSTTERYVLLMLTRIGQKAFF